MSSVLHVPLLKYNLLSMSSALDKGLKLESDNQQCKLKKGDITVAVGYQYEDLYKMRFKVCNEISNNNPETNQAHVAVSDSQEIWHERLAH